MSTRELMRLAETLAVVAGELAWLLVDRMREWLRGRWVPGDLDSDGPEFDDDAWE